MIRLGATLVLSATLAILAAGCGGGGTSAEEEWAGDICTTVGGWQDEVEQSASDLREAIQSPGAGTLAAIDTEVQEIIDATEMVGDDLRELEPPDTEEGEQAKRELDTLATQLESTAAFMKETFDELPEDPSLTDFAEALEPLLPSIQSLVGSVSSTFTAIKESGSQLEEGFDDADSCERYR